MKEGYLVAVEWPRVDSCIISCFISSMKKFKEGPGILLSCRTSKACLEGKEIDCSAMALLRVWSSETKRRLTLSGAFL